MTDPTEGEMRTLRVGRDALLVEVADTAAVTALYRRAWQLGVRATDIVPGARTVLFDGVADPDGLAAQVRTWTLPPPDVAAGTVVEVPTVYDGADLADVAARWAMTPAEAVALHTGTEFTVAFCGFAPGFAYCTGLPDRYAVPRLDAPRARVP